MAMILMNYGVDLISNPRLHVIKEPGQRRFLLRRARKAEATA
jgi:hypothetical protein